MIHNHPTHPLAIERSGWECADYLAEARARQAGAGFASPLLSVTNEQLAQADAMISWRLVSARRRAEGRGL